MYIVESVPAVRNATPFQRIFFLSKHYNVHVISLYSKSVSGLEHTCTFKRNPFFRLWLIGSYLFPIWCLWKASVLRKRGPLIAITSPVALPLLSGFLINFFLKIKWVADIYDMPNLDIETFERKKGLRSFFQFRLIILFDKIIRKILKKSDLVLCTLLPEALNRYKIRKNKLFALTNGVELTPIKKMMNKNKLVPMNGFVVLYIGYVLRIRGIQTIIEAANRLKDKYHDIEWILVGPSYEKEIAWLNDMKKKFELGDRISWTGEVPHEKALNYIGASNVCVFTFPKNFATNCIYPIKIFEYMAMGKAIIATDLKGIRQVLTHEKSALFVKPENAEDLSEAVERLYLDENLRYKIGRCAMDDVGPYDWDNINNSILLRIKELAQ